MDLFEDTRFRKLSEEANNRNGIHGQIDQLHEEIGELMVAIRHHNRGKATLDDVLEEVCDLEQMILSVTRAFGIKAWELNAMRRKKLDKFEDYLVMARAEDFALKAHAGQTYGNYTYDFHLRSVVSVLRSHGVTDTSLLASGWLHDVVEDTDFSVDDIEKSFGSKVAKLVYAVTDEPGKSRKERKAKTYSKIRGNKDATILKLADRCANLLYSLETDNKDMLSMYRKEHAEFSKQLKEGLLISDTEQELWDRVDGFFVTSELD
jgi:guanosine-3',5'-bis(diphosphate) 3'-pyrophosphohydrolase